LDVSARAQVLGERLEQHPGEEAGGVGAGQFVQRSLFPISNEKLLLRGRALETGAPKLGYRMGANAVN
jgi:hypothetical protein